VLDPWAEVFDTDDVSVGVISNNTEAYLAPRKRMWLLMVAVPRLFGVAFKGEAEAVRLVCGGVDDGPGCALVALVGDMSRAMLAQRV
jgi:hypothetical protein